MEEEGDEAESRSAENNKSSLDADVVHNNPSSDDESPQPRSDLSSESNSDARSAVLNSTEELFPSPPDAPTAPGPSILKKARPLALGAWLHYSDGTVENIPVEQYKQIRKVAFGIATEATLPECLQPQASSAGGSGTSGTTNVSDGCLAGPSTTPMSDPGEERPLAVSAPRADPVSPQPGPSISQDTGYEPLIVDPSTGAKSKFTSRSSGSGF